MGHLSRPAPWRVNWLWPLLLAIGATSLAELIIVWLELDHLASNWYTLKGMDVSQSERDLSMSELRATSGFAVWVALLGLLTLGVSYLTRTARHYAWPLAVVVCTGYLFGQLLLMPANVHHLYQDPFGRVELAAQVNTLLMTPGFRLVFYATQIIGSLLCLAALALLVHPSTKEYLKIRLEPAKDPEWEAVMAAKRSRD